MSYIVKSPKLRDKVIYVCPENFGKYKKEWKRKEINSECICKKEIKLNSEASVIKLATETSAMIGRR